MDDRTFDARVEEIRRRGRACACTGDLDSRADDALGSAYREVAALGPRPP